MPNPRSLALALPLLLGGCGSSAPTPTVSAEAPGISPTAQRPSTATCQALRPAGWQPERGQAAAGAALRVVGIQYKQDVSYVRDYASFATKMRCLMEDHVVPVMQPGLPTLVVFNEDIGLLPLATGTRGATVRAQAQTPLRAPLGDAAPVSLLAALEELNLAYAPQIAAYQLKFGLFPLRKEVFVGATDTLVRAFVQTFSAIAGDYGVYVVASASMPEYTASSDPADIALFGDPDLSALTEVYLATSSRVTNSTFLWGPRLVNAQSPAGETNLLFRNEKVPLTAFEQDDLGLDNGPSTGPAAIANAEGYTVAGLHLGFATSLPAFAWGYGYGARPAGFAPCADLSVSYMPCMDSLGVDVVVQAEANDGRWATDVTGSWQPLQWMGSSWRAVSDPSVGFRYAINPMMTGNLLDLPFDGQSAIFMRGGAGTGRYIGDSVFDPSTDQDQYQIYVGDQPGFLALASWVTPDANRTALAATGKDLSPGSGSALENDYVETAVWADLVR
jgi:hypothetical protein